MSQNTNIHPSIHPSICSSCIWPKRLTRKRHSSRIGVWAGIQNSRNIGVTAATLFTSTITIIASVSITIIRVSIWTNCINKNCNKYQHQAHNFHNVNIHSITRMSLARTQNNIDFNINGLGVCGVELLAVTCYRV